MFLLLLMAAITLIIPAKSADTEFWFSESFICPTGNPYNNNVTVRVCEIDAFSDDCTDWQTKAPCGYECSFMIHWSDDGDEWPGTEFEFKVEFKHTCKGGSGNKIYRYPNSGLALDYPIYGPAVRYVEPHIHNLTKYDY